MSAPSRSVVLRIAAGCAFGFLIVQFVAGYLAAVPAPRWVAPIIRHSLGMFGWHVIVHYVPVAACADLMSAFLKMLLRARPKHLVGGLILGWLVIVAIEDVPYGGLSTFADASYVGLLATFTALVSLGFTLGGALVTSMSPDTSLIRTSWLRAFALSRRLTWPVRALMQYV